MNKSIIAVAGLLLTTSAFASTMTVSENATLETGLYNTKAEAYNAGFDLSDSVKAMSQTQLRKEFPVDSYTSVKNINVDDSEVTVEEIATNRGKVQYRAIVDLDYRFDAKETH